MCGCGKKGAFAHVCRDVKRYSPCEKQDGVSWKVKNRTTMWPSNPNSKCLSKRNQISILRDICTSMFIAVLVTIANNTCKHSKCLLMNESIGKIDKMCCLLTVDYYSQWLKKKEIMPFATTLTNLGGIMFSEFSQNQEQKLYDLICGI